MLREQQTDRRKDKCCGGRGCQIHREGPGGGPSLSLAQVLGQHDADHRSHGRHQYGEDGGELPCKAHPGYLHAAKLTNHNLVHHAEGRLQHRLQGDGEG